jgi:anti-anti-sigma factor
MLSFTVKGVQNAILFDLKGDFTVYGIAKIKEAIGVVKEKGVRDFIFNFASVDFIDSTGIGYLITVQKELQVSMGNLHLVVPDGNLLEAIKISRSDRLLKIFPTVETASAGMPQSQL